MLERYREWHTTPTQYAAQVRALVDATLRDAGAVQAEKPRVLIVSAAEPAATPTGRPRARRAPRRAGLLRRRPRRAGCAARRSAVGPGSIHLVAAGPLPRVLSFYGGLPFRVRGSSAASGRMP